MLSRVVFSTMNILAVLLARVKLTWMLLAFDTENTGCHQAISSTYLTMEDFYMQTYLTHVKTKQV